MGGTSRGEGSVCFVVTGFGPFQGVEDNPTEWLAMKVQEYSGRGMPLRGNGEVVACAVLDVAAQNAKECVEELLGIAEKHAERVPRQIVLVHFGVDTTRDGIHVERRAFNEAHFRCPDNQGWQPHHHVIDRTMGDRHAYVSTTLPVTSIVNGCKEKGYPVHVSDNAGRFVCNWTYFQSLALTHGRGHSIFVHVPPADRCSLEVLGKFAWEFLNTVGEHVSLLSGSR